MMGPAGADEQIMNEAKKDENETEVRTCCCFSHTSRADFGDAHDFQSWFPVFARD
jgi:hypothetical protein